MPPAPPAKSPLASFAGFLALFGLSYRLMFSGVGDSFLNNGLADVIIFTALLFYIFAALRPAAPRIAVNLPAAALILLTLIYALSSRLSHYPRAAWMENASIAALACLFLAVSGALFTKRDSPRAAIFLVALSVVSVCVALLQYFYEFPRMLEKIRTLTPPFLPRDIGVYVSERNAPDFITRIESLEIFSTFFVSNAFAGFLALALPVTLGLAVASLAPGAKSAPPPLPPLENNPRLALYSPRRSPGRTPPPHQVQRRPRRRTFRTRYPRPTASPPLPPEKNFSHHHCFRRPHRRRPHRRRLPARHPVSQRGQNLPLRPRRILARHLPHNPRKPLRGNRTRQLRPLLLQTPRSRRA